MISGFMTGVGIVFGLFTVAAVFVLLVAMYVAYASRKGGDDGEHHR